MMKAKGFTLIEVMIVVVIVAILAAIAYPAYTSYVQKARRADAMDALMHVQNLQERHRASNPVFGALGDIGYPGVEATGAQAGTALSNDGHYRIAVTSPTATGFTATATAIGSQAADTDCATLSIVVNANNPRGDKQSTGGGNCWRN